MVRSFFNTGSSLGAVVLNVALVVTVMAGMFASMSGVIA
jgi:hypothetical protein